MAKRKDVRSRGEISEQSDTSRRDMREQEEQMDVTASDVETIRSTLEALERGGTTEGVDGVESAVEDAEDVTVDVFEEQDEALEQLQDGAEQHEEGLEEMAEATERDLGRLSDGSARIETGVAVNEFVKAKDAELDDVEFLRGEEEKVKEGREESDRIQDEYKRRVHLRNGG